jgi:hypothetical protein
LFNLPLSSKASQASALKNLSGFGGVDFDDLLEVFVLGEIFSVKNSLNVAVLDIDQS